ncbi:hypothetical protein [Streptomyces mirabilis]
MAMPSRPAGGSVGTYLEDLAVAQREQRPRQPSNAHLDLPGRAATTGGCWRC